MNKTETWFQLAAAGAAAWLLNIPVLVWLLVGLQAMDIVTGIVGAGITGKVSSPVAFRGISRKVMALLLVVTAAMAGWALEEYTGVPLVIVVQAVAGFYCAGELLSILENAVRAGLPVPKALTDLVSKLSSDGAAEPDRG